VMYASIIETGLQVVPAGVFGKPRREVLRVMHVVEVIVGAETVSGTHGDVRERGRRYLADVGWVETQAHQIESLADLVAVVREPVEAVTHRQHGCRVDRDYIVELRRVHPAAEPPLIRRGNRGEPGVSGLQ